MLPVFIYLKLPNFSPKDYKSAKSEKIVFLKYIRLEHYF